MKILVFVLSLILSSASFADQYLCIVGLQTGFHYNKSSQKWESAPFEVTDEDRYIITTSKKDGIAYDVKMFGFDFAFYDCELGFNVHGFLNCDSNNTTNMGGYFKFNKFNGRFIKTSGDYGYHSILPESNGLTDSTSPWKPSISIGQCSKF